MRVQENTTKTGLKFYFFNRMEQPQAKFGNLVIKSDTEVENFRQRIYNKVSTVRNYISFETTRFDMLDYDVINHDFIVFLIPLSYFVDKKETDVWGIGF